MMKSLFLYCYSRKHISRMPCTCMQTHICKLYVFETHTKSADRAFAYPNRWNRASSIKNNMICRIFFPLTVLKSLNQLHTLFIAHLFLFIVHFLFDCSENSSSEFCVWWYTQHLSSVPFCGPTVQGFMTCIHIYFAHSPLSAFFACLIFGHLLQNWFMKFVNLDQLCAILL